MTEKEQKELLDRHNHATAGKSEEVGLIPPGHDQNKVNSGSSEEDKKKKDAFFYNIIAEIDQWKQETRGTWEAYLNKIENRISASETLLQNYRNGVRDFSSNYYQSLFEQSDMDQSLFSKYGEAYATEYIEYQKKLEQHAKSVIDTIDAVSNEETYHQAIESGAFDLQQMTILENGFDNDFKFDSLDPVIETELNLRTDFKNAVDALEKKELNVSQKQIHNPSFQL